MVPAPPPHSVIGLTMTTDLLEAVADGVAVLTLNRPDSLNALTNEMTDALLEALPRLERDPAVGVIVLTGAGRAFCAGGDVKKMRQRPTDEPFEARAADLRRRVEISRLLHESAKITLAAVNGVAAGAGFSLALACDLRVAAPSAAFVTSFARVGLSGDYGGTWFLSRLVGPAKAMELFLTSDKIGVEDARTLGLLNQVATDEDGFADAWRGLAQRIANGPRVTNLYIKRNIRAAAANTLPAMLDLEVMHQVRCARTQDHAEAARAFAERRPPTFVGR